MEQQKTTSSQTASFPQQATPQGQMPAQQMQGGQPMQQPGMVGPKKSIWKKWWFWMIILIALIIIGLGVYFLL